MPKINCISTPRNISTALMYSFAERADTTVFDEPFYGRYLRLSGKNHPGHDDILATQPLECADVFERLHSPSTAVVYVKNMAHHMRYVPLEDFSEYLTILLIRDPARLIPSFAKVYHQATMDDLGLADQLQFFNALNGKGEQVAVVDSGELLKNPPLVLANLCQQIGIDYDENMLTWEQGPRAEDGSWAEYWYSGVHASTGFGQPPTSQPEVPAELIHIYREAQPIYETLYEHAIKV